MRVTWNNRPIAFCFWLAARCNHQVHRNLIISGPDLSTSNWIVTTFDQCIKTLTLAVIGERFLPWLHGVVRNLSSLALFFFVFTSAWQLAGIKGTPTGNGSSFGFGSVWLNSPGRRHSYHPSLWMKCALIELTDCEVPIKFIKTTKVKIPSK